jgi:hypothetical protein
VVEAQRLDEGQIRRRDVAGQMFLRVPSRVHHLREPVARVDAPLQGGEPRIQAAGFGPGSWYRAGRRAFLRIGKAAGTQPDQDHTEGETHCEAERFRSHGLALHLLRSAPRGGKRDKKRLREPYGRYGNCDGSKSATGT